MNQVALVGNITDDPELRYTQSGAALAGFTVAVSHRSKHNGEWQDVNDGFFRCTAWRSVAENASRTLRKGMRVFVAGKLVQRSWRDNEEQQAPQRRDPGHPRGTGSSVRYRRRSQVHRRGFEFVLGRSFGCVLDQREAERLVLPLRRELHSCDSGLLDDEDELCRCMNFTFLFRPTRRGCWPGLPGVRALLQAGASDGKRIRRS
jgi:hypothetical protein